MAETVWDFRPEARTLVSAQTVELVCGCGACYVVYCRLAELPPIDCRFCGGLLDGETPTGAFSDVGDYEEDGPDVQVSVTLGPIAARGGP